MVISKENPTGIDVVVAKMQSKLEEQLEWANMINIYPRCYPTFKRVENKTVRLIEHYERSEYTNLIAAEENKCFFVQDAETRRESLNKYATELEVYFTVNLQEAKPDVLHRADEEVHADVLNILKSFADIQVNRLITGIEEVYRGYNYNSNDDTHPNHCFKVVLDILRFDINAKC